MIILQNNPNDVRQSASANQNAGSPKTNRQPGMTLIEAVVALAMFGILATSVIVLQQSSYANITAISGRLRTLFYMGDVLYKAHLAQEQEKTPPKTTTLAEPAITITYEQQKISGKSLLKDFKHVVVENITASWQDDSAKHEETLINMIYKPESEKRGEAGI